MVGIRRGEAADAKLQALVRFTRRMLATHGHAADGDLADLRAAGYTDAHVTEVVMIIGVVTTPSTFNNLNQTEPVKSTGLDFPAAPEV